MIQQVDGAVDLYGISCGVQVALEFARRHPDTVRSLTIHEIPCVVDDTRLIASDLDDGLRTVVAEGRPAAAVRCFLAEANATGYVRVPWGRGRLRRRG
ncbi:hypothetical protein [Kribbella sp. NPDC049227]|uniref:hypothetical protein n=1 Tax=Kribbella sp. NPDC049227 TaxID=3364113 RepID=UPI00371A6348